MARPGGSDEHRHACRRICRGGHPIHSFKAAMRHTRMDEETADKLYDVVLARSGLKGKPGEK